MSILLVLIVGGFLAVAAVGFVIASVSSSNGGTTVGVVVGVGSLLTLLVVVVGGMFYARSRVVPYKVPRGSGAPVLAAGVGLVLAYDGVTATQDERLTAAFHEAVEKHFSGFDGPRGSSGQSSRGIYGHGRQLQLFVKLSATSSAAELRQAAVAAQAEIEQEATDLGIADKVTVTITGSNEATPASTPELPTYQDELTE